MQNPTTILTEKSAKLTGSHWRCTAHFEEGLEFHELRFISPYQVEGWSKEVNVNQAEKMFTAVYSHKEETLHFQQEQESFQAVWMPQKIIAFVDNKTMIFYPVD